MLNADSAKRLSALTAAISALTIEDLDTFTSEQVEDLRLCKKYIDHLIGTPKVPCGLSPQEWEHVKNGRKIEAIKLVRKRANCSLSDAKTLVEQVAYNEGIAIGMNHGVRPREYSDTHLPLYYTAE